MQWWVQTRGERVDYRFLGEEGEPPRWWAPYLRLAVPEDRMLVVETGADGWWFYGTAMPSGRSDKAAPPRPIRNSLVARGDPGDAVQLGRLVLAWFSGELAGVLREALREETIGDWLSSAKIPPGPRLALDEALQDVGQEIEGRRRGGTWTGSTSSPAAWEELAATVRAAAEEGVAAVAGQLNLMSEVSEASGLPSVQRAVVRIFLLEGGSDGLTLFHPEGGARPLGANPPLAGARTPTSAGQMTRPDHERSLRWMLWTLLVTLAGYFRG